MAKQRTVYGAAAQPAVGESQRNSFYKEGEARVFVLKKLARKVNVPIDRFSFYCFQDVP